MSISENKDISCLSLNDQEITLLKIFKEALKNESLTVYDNFFEYGGDSISMMYCIMRANEVGMNIFFEVFMLNPTVSYLANLPFVKRERHSAVIHEKIIPLLPLQSRFFSKEKHWKEVKLLSRVVQLARETDLVVFENACEKLLSYHEALNLSFIETNGNWTQCIDSNKKFSFEFINLSAEVSEHKKKQLYEQFIETRIENDLKTSPLVKFLVIDLEKNKPYHFVVAAHHLCIDGVSMQIILQDIFYIYSRLIKNNDIFKMPQTTSYLDYVYFLSRHADSQEIKNDLDYWLRFQSEQFSLLPVDFKNTNQENLALDIVENYSIIDADLSSAIYKILPKKFKKISALDVLFSVLVLILNEFTNSNTHLIDIRRHGRDVFFEDIDLTKTVGWLTVVYPLFLKINTRNEVEALYSIKEQFSAVPKNGLSYGLLRYSISDPVIRTKIENLPKAQVAFNYHGVIDARFSGNDLFSFLQKSTGNNVGTKVTRSHLFNIDIMICEEKINIIWTYNKKFHSEKTIQMLQENYKSYLKKITTSLLQI